MRLAACLVAFTACTDASTGVHHALEGECTLLPPIQDLADWRGTPLYFATTRRAVTLTYNVSGARFAAYGIDVDARAVAFVMTGPAVDRDSFVAQLSLLDNPAFSSALGKVGEPGPSPNPPGDPELMKYGFLIDTAMAIADGAFQDPQFCN